MNDHERENAITKAYNAVTGQDDEDWNPDKTLEALKTLWERAAVGRTSEAEDVESGAKALFFEYYGNGWEEATEADAELCRANARAVLRAVGGGA